MLRESFIVLIVGGALFLRCASYTAEESAIGFLLPLLGGATAAVVIVDPDSDPEASTTTHTVNVAITGLAGTAGSLVLRNNGADDLTATADGTLSFATPIADGGTYAVTVATQPADRYCVVTSGSGGGTIAAADVSVTVGCTSFKRLWVSTITPDGELNGSGLTSADTQCDIDALKPTGGTHLAFAVVPGVREACANPNCSPAGGQIGWVLQPNTRYIRVTDNAVVFTTNDDAIFVFGTADTTVNTASDTFWTGLNSDWTTGDNCNDWSSNSSSVDGRRGDADETDSRLIDFAVSDCDNSRHILCVEQ